ncbi:MAG: tyrosine-type recombinase/integrase [Rhodospirillales bacterium]|nr:tyrosine-type recombinase/integrase [Rhodospirillales bacterium]
MPNHSDSLAPSARPALPIATDVRQVLADALTASKAPATRRAYQTAWLAWSAWAETHGARELPANPGAVAEYLAARFATGAGMGTLRVAVAAIAAVHELKDHPSPCVNRIVRTAMQGFARQSAERGAEVRQAKGLTAEAVAAIRGKLSDRVQTSKRAARDMAIVSVMADAGLRRSEAAALEWRDVAEEADGSGRITVRRSKTDQEADGAVVAITADAMADLDRLKAWRRPSDGTDRVFGLSGRQIARRIAAAAKAAGLGDGFSGHSGRVGMALRMTRNGAPAAATMRQGRWSTTRMVARYTRNEAAGEALRYL